MAIEVKESLWYRRNGSVRIAYGILAEDVYGIILDIPCLEQNNYVKSQI